MKTKTIVTEITRDDLINLFSTACYGSNFLGIEYDNEGEYINHREDGDCYEEIFAKMLLDGCKVEIRDYYAEDEDEFYGNLPHKWNEDDGCMVYVVGLDDIADGIARALDNGGWDAKCANGLINIDDCPDFDLPAAENLMQVIVFGEAIYG